jgi:hypothetical protein
MEEAAEAHFTTEALQWNQDKSPTISGKVGEALPVLKGATTFGITTLGPTQKKATLTIMKLNDYASVVLLSVQVNIIMLSVIIMNVIMLSVVMLSVIMLSVIMLSVIMLSVILLSVIMLGVVILGVVASFILLCLWILSIKMTN